MLMGEMEGTAIYLDLFPHTWSCLTGNEVPDDPAAATVLQTSTKTLCFSDAFTHSSI